MTAYLGDKPICLGGVKAIESVAGKVLHDKTLNGDGRQEPLGVDTNVMATMEYVHNREAVIRGDMVSLENVYTKDEVYKILEDYLPLVGKQSMSGWIGFDGKHNPNGNQALIVVQTASGAKGLIGAATDDNGMLRDVAVIDKLKGTTAQYTTVLATQIGSVTNHIPRIFAKKISSGTTHSAIDIPEASGTMARLEDIPDTYTKEEIDSKLSNVDLSDYATKADLGTKADKEDIPDVSGLASKEEVANKQDKLTAGTGITIEGNTISSTGGGDYLPLSGGTLTGDLSLGEHMLNFKGGVSVVGNGNIGGIWVMYSDNTISISANTKTIAGIQKLNNGADLELPTEGGTIARIEDIDSALGDISTALTAILGE